MKTKIPAEILAIMLVVELVLTGCPAEPKDEHDLSYIVTYSAGESHSTPPQSQTVKSGGTITLPGQGYMMAPYDKSFYGWTADGQSYAAGQSYTVYADVTFTALWTNGNNPGDKSYTVTFNKGDGSGTPPQPKTVNDGETITLPGQGNMTAPSGKSFNGWTADGQNYTASQGYTVYADVTFTAQWTGGGNPNPGGNPNAQEGVYIGLISFAGGAADLNYDQLVYLDSSGKSSLLNKVNSGYTKATQSGTALFYAVHKALANLTANSSEFPANIYSVNVLTFTDGLDNGSFGASNSAPLEGKSGVTSNDYAAWVNQEIGSRTINGKSITAYSAGVKGSDVQDLNKFNENLGNIASGTANVYSLTDFGQLQGVFTNIANSLDVTHSTTNFSMKTTLNDPGTIVRMTFDVSGSTSADAAASSRYIDGTLAFSNGVYSLTNIQYSAGITSSSGAAIQGTVNGSEVTFVFNNITGYTPGVDTAKQWFKYTGSSLWQINSEYDAGGATNTTVEKRTALVYLVLDSSTSLSDGQITQIRDAVTGFINNLYDRISQ